MSVVLDSEHTGNAESRNRPQTSNREYGSNLTEGTRERGLAATMPAESTPMGARLVYNTRLVYKT